MEILSHEQIDTLNIKDYKIIQSKNFYRFTSDAVVLSHFATASSNEVVCDICSGSGIVGLNYFALNEEKVQSVTLIEMQESLANMSKKSIELNNLQDKFTVVNKKVQDIDESLYNKFSLALCNPPYKKQNSGFVSESYELAVCKHEITINIDDIASASSKLLKRGGKLVLCNKCERLLDVLESFKKYNLNPTRLAFVTNSNNQPYLFLIEAVNQIKRPFKVEKNIVN